MTRLRKNAGSSGRIVFVGAGPGDPGMLTARATAALAEAGVVLVDPGVPGAGAGPALPARGAPGAARAPPRGRRPDLERPPVAGEPADVAKSAVEAAKKG